MGHYITIMPIRTDEHDDAKANTAATTKGWKMPPNAVYVGRPTTFGNRFTAEEEGSIAAAVAMFQHDVKKFQCFHPEDYARWIAPLRGKDLACWCALDKPCHADVLLELANE
jgi:Domain of unknown function (DUF4326)